MGRARRVARGGGQALRRRADARRGGGAVNRPRGRSRSPPTARHVAAAWSGVRARPERAAGARVPGPDRDARPRDGRFGAAQQLAPDGAVGGVAVRPRDGAAVVTWAHVVQRAAHRPGDGGRPPRGRPRRSARPRRSPSPTTRSRRPSPSTPRRARRSPRGARARAGTTRSSGSSATRSCASRRAPRRRPTRRPQRPAPPRGAEARWRRPPAPPAPRRGIAPPPARAARGGRPAAGRGDPTGRQPAPGGRWRSRRSGSTPGAPRSWRRAPRLSCTWNATASSSAARTARSALSPRSAAQMCAWPTSSSSPSAGEPIRRTRSRSANTS